MKKGRVFPGLFCFKENTYVASVTIFAVLDGLVNGQGQQDIAIRSGQPDIDRIGYLVDVEAV